MASRMLKYNSTVIVYLHQTQLNIITKKRCFSTTTQPKYVRKLKNGIPASYSFEQSFDVWMDFWKDTKGQAQNAQDKLMACELPYYNNKTVDSSGKTLFATGLKTLYNDQGDELNEIRVQNFDNEEPSKKPKNHLVMLHGYAASSCWWFKNLNGFINEAPASTQIHAVDMLGFGLSSRPTDGFKYDKYGNSLDLEYDAKTIKDLKNIHKNLRIPEHYQVKLRDLKDYLEHQKDLILEVENLYIDSLEKWRIANGIDRFDLVGHSFGGYISLAYALNYPENINKLVLVSPGGIERSPLAISNPDYRKIVENERDDEENPKTLTFKSSYWPGDYGFMGRYTSIKPIFKIIWDSYVSFFSFLRWLGPWGPQVLSERNLSKLARSGSVTDWEELDLFVRYLYQTNLKPSISETSLMRLFDSSVVAKYPMLDRISDLKVKDTLWIYGQHDFMYNDCGRAATMLLNNRDDGTRATFEVVSNAGHNLYLDNYKEFNSKVLKFLSWKK